VIALAGEDQNDRRCMRIVIETLCPDAKGRIVEINAQVRLRQAGPALAGRVDKLVELARAKAKQEDSALAAFFVHEDYDAIDCDDRGTTRARIQEALAKGFADSFYVLATWEIEAWLLLFPDALSTTRKGWAVPQKYLGRDTARIEDPKRVLTQEVSRNGPKYRESDAVEVLAKAVELDLLTKPQGRNGSWTEFTDAIDAWRR
jgi:hypothetical protein